MKRRVVAMMLSLTLCMGGTLEAGAAALSTPDVQTVAETDSDSSADSFSDEAGTVQQPQTDNVSEDSTGAETIPEETPDITETPQITETPSVTETPDTSDQTGDFNSGDAGDLVIDAGGSSDMSDGNTADNKAAEQAAVTGASIVNGVVQAKAADWEKDDMGFRLRKKKISDDTVPEGKNSADAEVQPDDETQQASENQADAVADASADTAEAAGETETSTEEMNLDNGAATQSDIETPSVSTDEGSVEDSYFTAQDGLLKINTDGHTGYYLFNESGYLVTGERKREPGTAGYTGTKTVQWYFLEKDKAVLYSDADKNSEITPYTSNLGQQQRKYWLWTGEYFHYYDASGDFVSVAGLKISGKLQKIGSAYYTLDSNGKPYTGIKKLKVGSDTFEYYFQPTAGTDGIPGKLFYGGWMYYKDSKDQNRFIYCSPKAATIGQVMKHGVYVSKVMSETNTFLLNSSGYLLKNTMAKAQNNAYYVTDSKGHVIKGKLVAYKDGYRYYFGSDGKRVTWKNSWQKCAGASNRYYYFGSTAGRVVKKTGWQKVTDTKGKFLGWFYFDKNGNHYKSKMLTAKSGKSYYFTSSGKVASGITTINNKKYFFATSNSKSYRGWMYKSTLIRYNNNWYYADSKGVLKKSGWQKVGKYWYYLSNYKVVTNKAMTRGKVKGRLDSQGRFSSGWVVVSDYSNKVKYIDPDKGDKYLTNTSRWIDGKLYYFDKNGYRRNDVSNIYGGPYYLDLDKTNGVITVYTSSNKKIPVKTIRVSVGLPATPTWDGTYRLSRNLRWQPLMGPSWGQYGTHVDGCGQGGIFVHSIAGATRSVYNLVLGEYVKLGNPASHGCIRACVADAKWVYENCNGSTIHIYSSGKYSKSEALKGPLGRNPIKQPYGSKTFDPTDPAV